MPDSRRVAIELDQPGVGEFREINAFESNAVRLPGTIDIDPSSLPPNRVSEAVPADDAIRAVPQVVADRSPLAVRHRP